jgi:hypothetical protein
MEFNTSYFNGIVAKFSMSIVSILSVLHYLLQDLIFNGKQIDFVHQQLFWRRQIANVELMRCKIDLLKLANQRMGAKVCEVYPAATNCDVHQQTGLCVLMRIERILRIDNV